MKYFLWNWAYGFFMYMLGIVICNHMQHKEKVSNNMEFPTYEQMAKNIAEKVLDEILYNGKSIREWMKIIIDQEQQTKWIPVSDNELPKEGEEVLVWYEYFRYGDYNCMWQTYGIGWQYDGCFHVDNGGVKQRVIAWQPLPDAYKESEE